MRLAGGALLVLVLSASMVRHAALAETVVVDDKVSVRESNIARPMRGMHMDAVEHSFGAPTTRHAAVGDPPITRWDYPSFAVFFERDIVIHAVVTDGHAASAPADQAPAAGDTASPAAPSDAASPAAPSDAASPAAPSDAAGATSTSSSDAGSAQRPASSSDASSAPAAEGAPRPGSKAVQRAQAAAAAGATSAPADTASSPSG
ncbi:MAG TPA: hypothetical protein VME21_15705 [Steroidobacteraceae bacterium]|nr:hypothetical protein [Steroidobacteraceae bacterium]